MADQTMRDELNDVKQHAKDAARASLMAVRGAVDFVLGKLDGDDAPAKEPVAGDPADRMTPTGTPTGTPSGTPTGTPDETPPPPPRDV